MSSLAAGIALVVALCPQAAPAKSAFNARVPELVPLADLPGDDSASDSGQTVPKRPKVRKLAAGECSKGARALRADLARLSYLPRRTKGSCLNPKAIFAVMAFQKEEKLQRDGLPGPKTQRAILRAERPKVPGKGRRVHIDLSKQLAYLARKGKATRTISISSGQPGLSTPSGHFSVYRKEEMSWSKPYSTWMPWASYFTGGIALHSSPDVPAYPASHGCVRVAEPFAREVYDFAGLGTTVRVKG